VTKRLFGDEFYGSRAHDRLEPAANATRLHKPSAIANSVKSYYLFREKVEILRSPSRYGVKKVAGPQQRAAMRYERLRE
jgi:hypothetical protein